MNTISTLDFLYIVLAVGLIPTFTLICMVLWRVYKTMDRVDAVLTTTENVIDFARNIDKVPGIVANKVMAGFNRFFH